MYKIITICFLGLILGSLSYGATAKKVIQMGYDDPNTALFITNINEMKSQPFDGTGFFAEPLNPTTRNQFSWQCWGTTMFSRSDLQHCIDELNAVSDYGNFTENFLRVTVAADKDVTWFVDWFDDFNSIKANMATATWMIKQGGAKGMFFDIESYSGQLWQYSEQKYKTTKTFAQYQAQVKQRGREVMQAMQAEDPNVLIFLAAAYSYVWGPSQINGNISELPNVQYGLLPAFLDGMLEVAGTGVRFVDGYEGSYKFKTLTEFQNARTAFTTDCLPIVADDAKYVQKYTLGFGLWMDVDHRIGGWYTSPTQQYLNYFNPDEFESALKYALSVADEYVWVYSETLFWWNVHGGNRNIPYTYHAAVRFGRSNEFMEFVPVEDIGNSVDSRPVTFIGQTFFFGNVPYKYQIGKYEVTNAQYCAFLNAVAASDPHELYYYDPLFEMNPNGDSSYPNRGGIERSGSDGSYTYSTIPGRAHLPVNWVSWRSAARFANWMHNGRLNDASTTEYGAYDASTFNEVNPNPNGWGKTDQLTHFPNAKYWIPKTNEWYKAAFYKSGGTNAGYWTYPTQSDTAPAPGPFDIDFNRANHTADNFDFGEGVDHGDMVSVGFYTASPGAYGTFDMGGNVFELMEEWAPAGYENNLRRRHGGAWCHDYSYLMYNTLSYDYWGPYLDTGFRLAFSGPQCVEPIVGDIYPDCKIDFMDMAKMVESWLECSRVPQSECY
ncbi:MAG: SUMF1/EgtB/PvdO family nonheme iron enzyme [Planctomycetaceae bacterium]|nr:SUMF1/EgtB/PvdO family nonheme iron enzyme [Planctomycetaceae bacterium]